MTVRELIRKHESNYPKSFFFSPDTLKFFGERISEMRVLKETQEVDGRECYVLSTYQRNAPEGVAKRRLHYFDVNTFEHIYVH